MEQQVLLTTSTNHLHMEGITQNHLLVLLVMLQQHIPGHMIRTVDLLQDMPIVVAHQHRPVEVAHRLHHPVDS